MTWVDAVDLTGKPPLDLYAAALYWSVMTLSTIGYGDITVSAREAWAVVTSGGRDKVADLPRRVFVQPQNTTETLIGVFCMLCGASLWAYVVGNVCGVVASLDVRTLAFRQTMDDLKCVATLFAVCMWFVQLTPCRLLVHSFFMSEKALDHDLRGRLREYFHQARHMHQTGNYEGLLRKLSPKLRGEVALATNRDWISKVSYFRHIRDECLSAIAVSLQASVYAPQEIVTGFKLHIVMRGVAGQQGRIITRGNVWGEDMILEARHLARVRPVRALTYLDVYALSREDLFDILEDYPATKKVRHGEPCGAGCVGAVVCSPRRGAAENPTCRIVDGSGADCVSHSEDGGEEQRTVRCDPRCCVACSPALTHEYHGVCVARLDPLTVLESKQDSHAAEEKQSLVHMEEADNVKNMMGSTLDASRIEARIALKVRALVYPAVVRVASHRVACTD